MARNDDSRGAARRDCCGSAVAAGKSRWRAAPRWSTATRCGWVASGCALIGIDAPELEQSCTDATGGDWACGRAARDSLKRLLAGDDVTCTPHGRDRYGRILARCVAGSVDLGLSMIEAGLAVADGDYAGDEAAATSGEEGNLERQLRAAGAMAAAQRADDGTGGLWATIRSWFH